MVTCYAALEKKCHMVVTVHENVTDILSTRKQILIYVYYLLILDLVEADLETTADPHGKENEHSSDEELEKCVQPTRT